MAVENVAGAKSGIRLTVIVVAAVPLLFLLSGLAIRYSAFASVSPDPSLTAYVRAFCKWDCSWYVDISEQGYERFPIPGRSNVGRWGFFPLYPMLVAAVRSVLPFSTIAIATAASLACGYLSCLVAWPLVDRNMRAYVLYCAFLLSGPFSFYFATFLTEPLFVLLTSCLFLALKRANYLAAGLACALLSATRVVGVLAVFAIVIRMFEEHRARGGSTMSFPRWLLGRPDLIIAILISPAGLFAYMLYLYLTVGDGFAFVHVQRAFGRVAGNPLLFLWDGLAYHPKPGWLPTAPQWSASTAILGLALSAVLAARRQFGAALFCAMALILPLTSNLASMVRYVVGLAPLTMMTAVLLSAWKATLVAALIVFLVTCYFMTVAWLGGYLALV
ncbi:MULTISPECIES: hypothetical protein [unclassified Mesorhizobium]|uniref:hypothetical protein n=1 Tax=unclassified Mesorhizobium TaxID=325217 RepID=UPI000BAF9868|nr:MULTISPECIES: hypothetical protein [unclassified Mesorhizobium]TGT56962.1 hypothetical protein EN813_041645 [Mesorhizobium sp. M00.F.Ca.ET.170.01.1.1]AZO08674.1 hypothetical protein EJ074_05740 [Mesorhizobium sp. M3A.F.Ca.ET.080.04.2.1]PBB85602.1 hypothetical protein CK216_18120 [Mesorhizobium sp. WSM3876]RWB71790.1 MAG: hypothetical protein EOQ49_14955 [Mesorhizobium sp.]RWB84957.1 MAG: hypothetical protein EOQ52_21950 [Mesorhizobium sp.]